MALCLSLQDLLQGIRFHASSVLYATVAIHLSIKDLTRELGQCATICAAQHRVLVFGEIFQPGYGYVTLQRDMIMIFFLFFCIRDI